MGAIEGIFWLLVYGVALVALARFIWAAMNATGRAVARAASERMEEDYPAMLERHARERAREAR
jgi:Na+-transporting methylmalonyl-CoA/oxaloacetate decarboxylase gamma subunit